MDAALVRRMILLFRKNNLERMAIALVNAWQYLENLKQPLIHDSTSCN